MSYKALLNLVSLFVASLLLIGCDRVSPQVRANIHGFHTAFNSSDYDKIYEDASSLLKASISKEKFVEILEKTKCELGYQKGVEEVLQWRMLYDSSPKVFVRQRSLFDKKSATEAFLFDISEDNFKLVQYQCFY